MKWHNDPEELKKTRKRLGLTQAELAAKAGVKLSLIANIEARRRQKSTIPSEIWEALALIDIEHRKSVPLKSLLGTPVDRPLGEVKQSVLDGLWSLRDGLQLLRGQLSKLRDKEIERRLERMERQLTATTAEISGLEKELEAKALRPVPDTGENNG